MLLRQKSKKNRYYTSVCYDFSRLEQWQGYVLILDEVNGHSEYSVSRTDRGGLELHQWIAPDPSLRPIYYST